MSRNEVKVRSRKGAVDVTEGGVERDSRIFPLQRFAQGRALSPGARFGSGGWLAGRRSLEARKRVHGAGGEGDRGKRRSRLVELGDVGEEGERC
jgi:hypothetical protein